MIQSSIRKIYFGVADRRQKFEGVDIVREMRGSHTSQHGFESAAQNQMPARCAGT
ncbi:hypothetical protein LB572_13720 [Mesorhizobium sp. BH1-1-5]|uniref:hypothetical protein n=1 Tax=unclassified Mesorhizobium TaxID=325217 RepID=UPI0015E44BF8|nr:MULTISPECIES: hypothetical protein [unclassified Mesorhizobium]MBZ9988152.1 hypothetical protein [Mesorhizobium sp. BH1-1-5]